MIGKAVEQIDFLTALIPVWINPFLGSPNFEFVAPSQNARPIAISWVKSRIPSDSAPNRA